MGLGILTATAAGNRIDKLAGDEVTRRQTSDLQTVQIYRRGLLGILDFVNENSALFPAQRLEHPRLLKREEKEAVWNAWKTFLDYLLALDSLGSYHQDFLKLKKAAREDSFLIAYAANCAKYRCALELIRRLDNDPAFERVFNDAVPELGLPEGTYSRLKFRFLNVGQAGQFLAWETAYPGLVSARQPELQKGIKQDSEVIWKFGAGHGELLTLKNAFAILKNLGANAWFPVQAGMSEWMGDTKVYRVHSSLITEKQVLSLVPRLEPGDIILVRHEWYLSNIGLPGFWPHAALYIGTMEERRRYFTDTDFEAILARNYPAAYQESLKPDNHKRPIRVLEAISEGVSFTALEHAADADSLVVLRPRLSKADKAAAILRAFHYAGRPYDFNFDFQTDAALVCTELVWKAYETTADKNGLQFPLVTVLGRQVSPANEFARQFDEQFGTPAQQTDFILFLDGQEKARRAVERDVNAFRASWQRPKWHIITAELTKTK